MSHLQLCDDTGVLCFFYSRRTIQDVHLWEDRRFHVRYCWNVGSLAQKKILVFECHWEDDKLEIRLCLWRLFNRLVWFALDLTVLEKNSYGFYNLLSLALSILVVAAVAAAANKGGSIAIEIVAIVYHIFVADFMIPTPLVAVTRVMSA